MLLPTMLSNADRKSETFPVTMSTNHREESSKLIGRTYKSLLTSDALSNDPAIPATISVEDMVED